MPANNARATSLGQLPWLAVVLASSACGGPNPAGSTGGGTAGAASPPGSGSRVEVVGDAPSASDEGSEAASDEGSEAIDPAPLSEATDTGADSPESVDGTPFAGGGGPSGGSGSSTREASGPAEGEAEGEAVVAAPACDIAHPGGVANHRLTSGGREREYRLFVPDSYDGETPLPLMLNLHGTGGDAAGQAQDSGMERLAQREGFVVVGLQGFENRWNVLMNDPNEADDVQYASNVLDDAIRRVCVDERKVYATGFSGGARMSSRLACNLSERITAIAPVSGIRWTAPCSGRPVPVVTFHGLADPQNTYAGMARDEWVESVEDALRGWARHNGCAETRAETPEVDDVSVYSYGDCDGGADVVLYRIAGLGHTWAKDAIDATQQMWTFLEGRSMP